MSVINRWAIGMGAWALCLLTSAIPALADDYHRDLHRDIERDRREVRQDLAQIRRDEDRLYELERERDRFKRCKDWRAVKDTEREIGYLKRRISDEKREAKRDIEDAKRDEKHERDYHDRQDRDRDRYYLDRDRDRDRYYNRDRYWDR